MRMKHLSRLMAAALCLALAGTSMARNPHVDGEGLPPGLQKKHQSGQSLPPGWRKKLSKGQILDESIYLQGRVVVPLGRDGSISIDVDGTLLRLHEKTRRILEILH